MNNSTQFLSETQKKQIRKNVDLKSLTNSDISFIYDLYITKYPVYKSFSGQLIADVINADLGTSITGRQIEVIRDITLQEEVLDNKLLMNNLGYYYSENLDELDG